MNKWQNLLILIKCLPFSFQRVVSSSSWTVTLYQLLLLLVNFFLDIPFLVLWTYFFPYRSMPAPLLNPLRVHWRCSRRGRSINILYPGDNWWRGSVKSYVWYVRLDVVDVSNHVWFCKSNLKQLKPPSLSLSFLLLSFFCSCWRWLGWGSSRLLPCAARRSL